MHATPNVIEDARVEPTSIEGLELHHTKVVGDSRGILAELIRDGSANPVLSSGFGNLYVSIAVGKHTGRAGHTHAKAREIFFTLTGSALWYFYDFRPQSPTFGTTFTCVLGFEPLPTAVDCPIYVLSANDMVRVIVPTNVYHAYWPLTDAPVMVVSVPSRPHDESDYDRRKPAEVPGCRERLAKYGITLN